MNKHLEKIYYEYLAKSILETFLPHDYHDLILSDAPDLRINEKKGIEVTRAMLEGEGQASGIFEHIRDAKIESVDPRYLSTLNKIDYQIYAKSNTIKGYGPNEALVVNNIPLKKVLCKKMEKIPQYDVESVDLFIFSPGENWFEENLIHSFMRWAATREGVQFRRIMVYEYPYLYVFEISNSLFSKIYIDKNKLLICRSAAKAHIDSIN